MNVKQYKIDTETSRKSGGRAPNVTKHYFRRDEVIKILDRSRNYTDACFNLGLIAEPSKKSGRAYRNLKMIAGWYSIDLDFYLIKKGKSDHLMSPPSMTREAFRRRILILGDKRIQGNYIKKWLFKFKIKERICEECGCDESWYNKPLVLELHHVNGQPRDNRLENLQILCPNCHSQTPTHRGRNRQIFSFKI